MLSRLMFRIALASVVVFTSLSTSVQAAVVRDRIAGQVKGTSRVAVQGTISKARMSRTTDTGAAPANQKLESMSLRFSLTAAQQADLTQLLSDQQTPGSGSYHQWLTPEQYGAHFGISSGDMAKVSAWLTSQGLTVTGVARSSNSISFSGSVAQAQQAFGTSIHSLMYRGEPHISNTTDPVLPSAIAAVVSDVTGLNDFKVKPRSRAKPLYTQSSGGGVNHYITPADLYTIYDYGSLNSANITGTGVTIAVMGQTDIITSNIATFRSAAGLPAINLTQKLIPTTCTPGNTTCDPGQQPGDIDEAHLDIEWSGASAPGASIVYVYSTDVFNSLSYAIQQMSPLPQIITISYGLCEPSWGTSLLASTNSVLAQANAEGITVVGPSGDTGAADCDAADAGDASEGLAVDFPASSPYAVSAGGTMFTGDVNSPSTYWSSTNSTTGGSALGYIAEQPWNETTATQGLTTGGAAGGGASAYFSKPAWQADATGAGVPSDGARDVPDISLNAAAVHDGYLVCTTGSTTSSGTAEQPCVSGTFIPASGPPNVFGGTSFVAPIFAGILARVEQKLGTTSGLGNVGPVLYGLANLPNIYHDTTSGNNSIECIQGTANCPNGGMIGYNAGVGYDLASGLGSIDVANMVNNWATAPVNSSVGVIGPGGKGCNLVSPAAGTASCITTTTLTTTASATCGVTGNFALSVTVAGTIPNTPPTGTVTFYVDNVAVTGGVVSLANGAATYSLNTGTLSSGGHTISAAYAGDANYAGSKGTLLGPSNLSGIVIDPNSGQSFSVYPNGELASVDVISATKPDFSITPCSGTVTVNPGASSTGITFTVTPVNGFTGTVNLTVTNRDGMAATPSFTVSPVTINGTAGVATSFVVKASQAASTAKLAIPAGPRSSGRAPWYVAGSGVTMAGMLLLTFPRRRRWGALLVAVLSVAALSAMGCGNNSSTTGNPTNPGTPTTNAAAGTYTFTITAVSSGIVHSTEVAVMVP